MSGVSSTLFDFALAADEDIQTRECRKLTLQPTTKFDFLCLYVNMAPFAIQAKRLDRQDGTRQRAPRRASQTKGEITYMSLCVAISNRQRQIKIDLKKWRALSTRLFAGVLADLEEDRPRHLSRETISELVRESKLSIIFVSDGKIKELNKIWRGKDQVTDVLSFPARELDEAGSAPAAPGSDPFAAPFLSLALAEEERSFVEVGELVISLSRAHEQARQYGHSFDRELSFLIVHGILHVLGFDHITKAQEKDMFARQERVLGALSLSRDKG